MIEKPGKKKKRKAVADGKRFSILTDELDVCYVCGMERDVELHEIFFGGNRNNSKRYGLVVPLCPECHQGTHGVHGSKGHFLDMTLKEEGQVAFEKRYPATEFIKVFGRNYL